jgi:hypothetical protein
MNNKLRITSLDGLIYKFETKVSQGKFKDFDEREQIYHTLEWLKEAKRQGLTIDDIIDFANGKPFKDNLNITEILQNKRNDKV